MLKIWCSIKKPMASVVQRRGLGRSENRRSLWVPRLGQPAQQQYPEILVGAVKGKLALLVLGGKAGALHSLPSLGKQAGFS